MQTYLRDLQRFDQGFRGYEDLAKRPSMQGHLALNRYLYNEHCGRTICARTESSFISNKAPVAYASTVFLGTGSSSGLRVSYYSAYAATAEYSSQPH